MPAARFSFSVILLLPLLGACSGVSYLLQAGKGQLALSNRAKPLEEVIADPKTPPRLRSLLKVVPDVKAFGERAGLKKTKNYSDYVDLKRDAVVYVVTACQPLEFRAKTWGFPVVGSFNYLGWFSKEDAMEHADELKAEGWDVDVRGASAYSTLGWFRDPILSSMVPRDSRALGALVNVVLHESVHASVYLNHQPYFNESLASFVADGMTLQYLDQKRGPASAEKKAYLAAERRSERNRLRLHAAYGELDRIYQSGHSDEAKRARKSAILKRLMEDLKYRRPINNATLIQYKTYQTGEKDFASLYARCGKNWPRFLRVVGGLKEKDFPSEQLEDFASVLAKISC